MPGAPSRGGRGGNRGGASRGGSSSRGGFGRGGRGGGSAVHNAYRVGGRDASSGGRGGRGGFGMRGGRGGFNQQPTTVLAAAAASTAAESLRDDAATLDFFSSLDPAAARRAKALLPSAAAHATVDHTAPPPAAVPTHQARATGAAARAATAGGDDTTEGVTGKQLQDKVLWLDLGLCKALVRAVAHIGYLCPTPVQAKTIPAALQGKDVCARAVTGSGKTAAFLLPTIHKLATWRPYPQNAAPNTYRKHIRSIVLVPSRELAHQSHAAAEQLVKFCTPGSVRIALVVGGVTAQAQETLLADGPEMVIATPGRLCDVCYNFNVSAAHARAAAAAAALQAKGVTADSMGDDATSGATARSKLHYKGHSQTRSAATVAKSTTNRARDFLDLAKVEMFVLDECDKLVAPELITQVRDIAERVINRATTKKSGATLRAPDADKPGWMKRAQVLLFSATMTNAVDEFAQEYLNDKPHNVNVGHVALAAQLRQQFIRLEPLPSAVAALPAAPKPKPDPAEDGEEEEDNDRLEDASATTRMKTAYLTAACAKYFTGRGTLIFAAHRTTVHRLVTLFNVLAETAKAVEAAQAAAQAKEAAQDDAEAAVAATPPAAAEEEDAAKTPAARKSKGRKGDGTKRASKKRRAEADEDDEANAAPIALALDTAHFSAVELQGNQSTEEREAALRKFVSGEVNFMFATDVASRGLDLEGAVNTVVNFDMPLALTAYIHRVGRTARIGRSGVAVSLVDEVRDADIMRAIIALSRNTEAKLGNDKAYSTDDAVTHQLTSVRRRVVDSEALVDAAKTVDAAFPTVREVLDAEELDRALRDAERKVAKGFDSTMVPLSVRQRALAAQRRQLDALNDHARNAASTENDPKRARRRRRWARKLEEQEAALAAEVTAQGGDAAAGLVSRPKRTWILSANEQNKRAREVSDAYKKEASRLTAEAEAQLQELNAVHSRLNQRDTAIKHKQKEKREGVKERARSLRREAMQEDAKKVRAGQLKKERKRKLASARREARKEKTVKSGKKPATGKKVAGKKRNGKKGAARRKHKHHKK